MDDASWMRQALAEAERGRGGVEPNPLVGAVIVRDGRPIASGYHARFGGPHAEINALREAGDNGASATLFVTLEPCCHHGKTPPCTDAVLAAGIARVVVAMADPFPRVAGGGLQILRENGLDVVVGVEEMAARRLNSPYLKKLTTGRPYVTAKWAMTLDGKIATAAGSSKWISGKRSRAAVHEVRGLMDAILVGIGTVLADDPELTARPRGPRTAVRVVLDSSARLPLESRLVRSAREIPVCVAVSGRAPLDRRALLADAGCDVIVLESGEGVPIDSLLEILGRRGMTNVLVEGGGRVLGSFFDAGQVDAVDVFLAPIIEGGPSVHTPVVGRGVASMAEAMRLIRHEISSLDGDVRLKGTFDRPWLHAHDA